jgi:hypothetical protein
MPLSPQQAKTLADAVAGYAFPTAHFDFASQTPVVRLSMSELETRIRQQLLSDSPDTVKDGLSNVLYWGFTQMGGLANVRVGRFRSGVEDLQIEQAAALFKEQPRPALYEIASLKMPEFSSVSFVSKIRMFLDPTQSATLDMQIMKIQQVHSDTVLAAIKQDPTRIRISKANSNAYEGWCERLADIARTYLPDARVADVERGFFQMIQDNKVAAAAAILRDA